VAPKIALLIDAENISHKYLPRILEEVPRHGQVVLRAVYGDWQIPALQKWHDIAEQNSFKIRHQSNASKTKNSSDMKLIMDAMEVLFRTPVDIFCLVTNDADYVPLCEKIHECKKQVIGVGYQLNASEALIRACDQFIFIGRGEAPAQSLIPLPIEIPLSLPKPPTPPAPPASNPPDIRKLLSKAFDKATQDANRWVILTALGQALSKIQPGFETNSYGHSKLSHLLQSMPDFVELQANPNGTIKSARLKQNVLLKQLQLPELRKLLSEAFVKAPQDANRWVVLGSLGNTLRQLHPDFKTNSYGHTNLTKLLQSMPDFVQLQDNGKGNDKSARLKK